MSNLTAGLLCATAFFLLFLAIVAFEWAWKRRNTVLARFIAPGTSKGAR